MSDQGTNNELIGLPAVYVANTGSDSISVIKGSYKVIPVGKEPIAMQEVINNKGHYVYVACKNKTIHVIDTALDQIIATMELPGIPSFLQNHNICTDEAGNELYISNQGSDHRGYVTVIDTLEHKVIRSIEVGNNPTVIVRTSDRYADAKELYVINEGEHSLVVVNLLSHRVVNTFHLPKQGPYHLTLSPDNKNFYIGFGDSGKFWIGDLQEPAVIKSIKINPTKKVKSINVSADGKYIYLGTKGTKHDLNEVYLYRTKDSSKVRQLILNRISDDPNKIVEVKIGDDEWMVYVGATGHSSGIIKTHRKGESYGYQGRIAVKGCDGYFDISSDHQYIVTANVHANTISYIELTTSKERQVVNVEKRPQLVLMLTT